MITRNQKKKAICLIISKMKQYIYIDPIGLCRIRKKYTLVRNYCEHHYDAFNLYNYIMSTGDFYDPISKIEYATCELLRLAHKVNMPSYHIVKHKDALLEERKHYYITMGLCDVFDNEMMDQIAIVRNELHSESFDLKLKFEILPLIIQCFDNFRSIHEERCLLVLQTILSRLKKDPLDHAEIQRKLCNMFELLLKSCSST